MKWDTIENRWKQFLGMLHASGPNPTKVNSIPATAVPSGAVIKFQDHRDEKNDLPDTEVFAAGALQIYGPSATN